jgi:trehalose 6-phosphate synthase
MEPQTWALVAVVAVLLFELLYIRRRLSAPVEKMTDWFKRVQAGVPPAEPALPKTGPLAPLARQAAALADELSHARDAARQEAQLRELGDARWTAQRLREHVRARLEGRRLVVVANREPYRHVRRGGSVGCESPASGLVTGLEPVLRACGGSWVAHGDGDADRESSDEKGRVAVPPGKAQYTLKRVWLTEEEERGYYYGFANEGLWPLCHIAHERPSFRPEDWVFYREVNAKFTRAVLEEVEGLPEPCLLVQDYHFTLLPRLLKAARPDARVALFWHIPWPNPEAFGICPWQTELLEGMLGADLIGFHTQWHCNNFLETVDRTLECRIDRERFSVRRADHETKVRPLPISVDLPEPGPPDSPAEKLARRTALFAGLGAPAERLLVGVDRIDYTKGIVERFRGLERLLEKYPQYRGRVTLAQIGAPSRMHIPAYARLNKEVEAEAQRINARYAGAGAPPIVLLRRQHSHEEIQPYLRAADLCLVTSLHDGMNLVAKEFVAARSDADGVLVLSRFTGASRELTDALLVNPYDVDEVAEALRAGLEMPAEERARRMTRLRDSVAANNIYRWAADLVTELASVRLEAAEVRS